MGCSNDKGMFPVGQEVKGPKISRQAVLMVGGCSLLPLGLYGAALGAGDEGLAVARVLVRLVVLVSFSSSVVWPSPS